jgi:hypothetical protein
MMGVLRGFNLLFGKNYLHLLDERKIGDFQQHI